MLCLSCWNAAPRDRTAGEPSGERSVDMAEPREFPPGPQPGRPPLAAASRLSPLQQAYAAYTDHAIHCDACRDIDRTCSQAETLWRGYQAAGSETYRRMADEAP